MLPHWCRFMRYLFWQLDRIGRPRFACRSGHRLSLMTFPWFSLLHSDKFGDSAVPCHDLFVPYSVQFIFHPLQVIRHCRNWVTNSIAKSTARFRPAELLCGAGKFDEILSVSGQHEIEYTEWNVSNYTATIYIYNFTCVIFCANVQWTLYW